MSLVVGWLVESLALRLYGAVRHVVSRVFTRNMNDLALDGPGTAEGWKKTFEALTKYDKEADQLYEEAVSLDEGKQQQAALAKYSECMTVMEQALTLPIVCPPNANLSWERAGIILQKLKKTKEEVNGKIVALGGSAAGPTMQGPSPPSYEEAMGISGTSKSSGTTESEAEAGNVGNVGAEAVPALRTYRELGEALNTLRVEEAAGDAEVIFACNNVRLYFISPDGSVSSSSEPERMVIVHYSDSTVENRPPAYLQVGSWIYPLVPGVSPCFRTSYRAFILPDIHADVEGSAVGLIFPEDVDESVFEVLEIIFDGLLEGITLQLAPEERSRARREVPFAHSVVRGARWMSGRLISGAERAGNLMNRSTPKLLQHIEQEQPKEFSPNVAKGFEVAKNVSGKAVQVTGYVAGKVGLATSALGRFLAPHIQKQGTRLLTSTFKMEEVEAKNKMENILEVTAGAVEAFGTVYGALDQSAHILAGSLANNTVTLVKHKYGAQAGQVAGNTFDTVGNVYVASHAVKRLNPKYFAKSAVKAAGKAVIEEQRLHLREDANFSGVPKEEFPKSD